MDRGSMGAAAGAVAINGHDSSSKWQSAMAKPVKLQLQQQSRAMVKMTTYRYFCVPLQGLLALVQARSAACWMQQQQSSSNKW